MEKEITRFSIETAMNRAMELGFKRSLVWWRTCLDKGKIPSEKAVIGGRTHLLISNETLLNVIKDPPKLKVVISGILFLFLFSGALFASTPDWKEIIIHHTDTQNGKEYSLERCNDDHKQRGFNECGYHFLLQPRGSITIARSLDKAGAHCKGQNRVAVGVAVVGNGEITAEQLEALRRVTSDLERRYGRLPIYPHRFFRATECPSTAIWDVIRRAYGTQARS